MQFFLRLTAALSALTSIQAAHFSIPEVDEVVAAVKQEYSAYFHHEAAPGTSNTTRRSNGLSDRAAGQPYWFEQIAHQGIAAFNSNPSGYKVYRNVKDFGARGDGSTDDTAAINAALQSGGTCGQGCPSSTTQPVVAYFPAGTYMVSSPLHPAYYTMMIGNPNNLPILKATSGFSGFGIIDADPYYSSNLKNFVIDTTGVPANTAMNGIHWPTAQSTSIQNVDFQLSQASGTQHVGLFIESGSAGILYDLTFTGGLKGAALGNQQFMLRNLQFHNCQTAISMFWDWTFAIKSLLVDSCGVGIDMSAGGSSSQAVGSVTLYDSSISNTNIGVLTAWTGNSSPASGGSLVLENVALTNVGTAVTGANNAVNLAGGSYTVSAYAQGHQYTPNGPNDGKNTISPVNRPGSLLSGNKYYERSKPQYEDLSVNSFVSARSSGARGDGRTDDTSALQNAINSATSSGKVLYLDHGNYLVRSTITIPPGAKIVGEAYPVIMGTGSAFSDMNNPTPVVRVGNSGQTGTVELSDFIVSTQGGTAGAVTIEYNLASSSPSGLWDVHVRIGGYAGSNLQVAQCPTSAQPSAQCIAAHTGMHITKTASNVYLENVWIWTADHDIDSSGNTQISVYSGRGLLIEATAGNVWLSGTSVEHFVFYQYQLSGTSNIYLGQAQTETPYYQPNPSAPAPFTYQSSLNDPNFAQTCSGQSGNCANAWGFRAVNSQNIAMYGGGFYSFFNSYSTSCSDAGGAENCQNSIVSIENSSPITLYNLNTVGTTAVLTVDGQTQAKYQDNINSYTTGLAFFRK